MISKPLAVRKTQMPTKSDFRIHWHPMKYFFIIHWHKSETIGINFQVENVGNLKKTSQNTLAHFFNSVGSTNGKPLAHTLSQKSLAIHQFIVESYGTHSVYSWHATTKHPGTPRCEQVWFWVHGDMGGTTRAVLQRDSSRFIMS